MYMLTIYDATRSRNGLIVAPTEAKLRRAWEALLERVPEWERASRAWWNESGRFDEFLWDDAADFNADINCTRWDFVQVTR